MRQTLISTLKRWWHEFPPSGIVPGDWAPGLAVQQRVLPLTLACEGGFSEPAGEDGCYISCWATGRKNALSLLQS